MARITDKDRPSTRAHKAWFSHKRGWQFRTPGDEARIELAFKNGFCAAIKAERKPKEAGR